MELEEYDKIYKDTDEIIENESLENLNEYAKKFIGDKDRGKLRTILLVLKPFKDKEEVKETFEILSNELRIGSIHGII